MCALIMILLAPPLRTVDNENLIPANQCGRIILYSVFYVACILRNANRAAHYECNNMQYNHRYDILHIDEYNVICYYITIYGNLYVYVCNVDAMCI